MIRLLSTLVLVSGCWCIGQSRYARESVRIRRIRRIADGLGAMESALRATCAPLPEAFALAGSFDPLFAIVAASCGREDADILFQRVLSDANLEKEENEILTAFAAGLTAADVSGQLQNAANCRSRLYALLKTVSDKTERLHALYGSTGLMAGAVFAILLF